MPFTFATARRCFTVCFCNEVFETAALWAEKMAESAETDEERAEAAEAIDRANNA